MGTKPSDIPAMTNSRLVAALREIEHSLPRAAADRIEELEAALRELLDHDDGRFGYEGEKSEVEKRCRKILDKS